MTQLWAAGVALVLAVCTVGAVGDTYCAPPDVSNVTIASRTHVCVVFNGVARAYFTPEADKMTRLQFNGSTCVCACPCPWVLPVPLHLRVYASPVLLYVLHV